MDEPRPEASAYVTVGGTEYQIVSTSKLTIPELKEAKRVSGMVLADMEVAFEKGDADAWIAMLYVSIRRARPQVTVDDILADIGDTPLVAIIKTLRDDTPESAQQDPPTLPSEGGSPQNENGSGETTQPPSIPATSGFRL